VAGLRALLGAAGQEIKQLVGFSALLEERLLPVDTVNAAVLTQGGRSGTIALSFGTEFKSGLEIEILTTKGSVAWTPKDVKVKTAENKDGETTLFEWDSGVAAEVHAFASSVEAKTADERQTPREALKDLEILEGLLTSGEAKGALVQF
jgi:predicted dehydrogenase